MRIRTIKPEFWSHPVLAKLPESARLMAIGLLTYADDEGFFLADPVLVRNALFPFDETCERLRSDLQNLEQIGYIERIHHPERGFLGRVVKFRDHQKISHPTASKIKVYWVSEKLRIHSGVIPETLRPDQGSGIKGSRDQGSREQGSETAAAAAGTPESDHLGTDSAVAKASTHMPPIPAEPSILDITLMHPGFVAMPSDYAEGAALLRLYGYARWTEVLPGLFTEAAKRPPDRRGVFVSHVRKALAANFTPEPDDYRRAGLPVPQEAMNHAP